jgi:hypothetical protein
LLPAQVKFERDEGDEKRRTLRMILSPMDGGPSIEVKPQRDTDGLIKTAEIRFIVT